MASVPVSLTVTPANPPLLSVNGNGGPDGGARRHPANGQVTVSNAGGDLQFAAVSDQAWLTLASGGSGSAISGGPAALAFTANPGNIDAWNLHGPHYGQRYELFGSGRGYGGAGGDFKCHGFDSAFKDWRGANRSGRWCAPDADGYSFEYRRRISELEYAEFDCFRRELANGGGIGEFDFDFREHHGVGCRTVLRGHETWSHQMRPIVHRPFPCS